VRIEVLAIAPDGVPAQFRSSGRSYSIAQTWGPERIETGWWRTASGQRQKKTGLCGAIITASRTTAAAVLDLPPAWRSSVVFAWTV
jgi:hypothetical protein